MIGREPILEVAIGLILVYLLLSLLVAAMNEGIAAITNRRGKFLVKGLENLIGKSLSKLVREHGLLRQLGRKRKRLPRDPSYIGSGTFATAFLDVVARLPPPGAPGDADGHQARPPGAVVVPAVEEEVTQLRGATDRLLVSGVSASAPALPATTDPAELRNLGDTYEAVRNLLNSSATLDQARAAIAGWFDEAMERVSGWYKRYTRLIVFLLGLGTAVALNADSVTLAISLWKNPALRAAAVETAQEAVAEPTPGPTPEPGSSPGTGASPGTEGDQAEALQPSDVVNSLDKIRRLQLPLGWVLDRSHTIQDEKQRSNARDRYLSDPRRLPRLHEPWEIAAKVIGLLLTVLAITFGAPFWFDLLKKLVGIRGSGPAPPETATASRPAAQGAAGTPAPGSSMAG